MSFNVLETARHSIPDLLVNKAALALGETELNTRKAIRGATPSVMAGLLFQLSRTNGSSISDLLKSVAESGLADKIEEWTVTNKTGDFAFGANGPAGQLSGWLRQVFGGKLINIINAISIYADVKSSSASAILNMAALASLGTVSKHVAENNLRPEEIENFLQSQKAIILASIPAGFNLAGSLGVDNLQVLGLKIHHIVPEPLTPRKSAQTPSIKWLWLFLVLITLGGIAWYFFKKDSDDAKSTIAGKDTVAIPATNVKPGTVSTPMPGKLDSVTGNYMYDVGPAASIRLADSSILQVGENSTEARLYRMLSDATWIIDTVDETKNWVTFDRVFFQAGQANLTTGSQDQLRNIAIILKNFPGSVISIGGFTDNTGDSTLNKKISADRARVVFNELLKLGAGVPQLSEANGYGQDHPVCPLNDSPECKARNRRVDLKLVAK